MRSVSTLLLLRMQARTERVQYKSYWKRLCAIQSRKFVFDTPELCAHVVTDQYLNPQYRCSKLVELPSYLDLHYVT